MVEVLRFENVNLRRGQKVILKDINWTVQPGERWIILGRNGAGKTTLLQIAAARLHPSSGVAMLLGERLGRIDVLELRPRIGLASAALADRIPGGEKVIDVVLTASYGVLGRWREEYDNLDVDRARDLLAGFGVEHLADRFYGTLSEGERKRVQVARALMTDPEILLLDEPGAGLDLGGREELIAALTALARDPRSPVMIMVTHHLEEIPPGFDHAMVMRDGEVESAGPIEEALSPQHLSRAFGLELSVETHLGRWSARAMF